MQRSELAEARPVVYKAELLSLIYILLFLSLLWGGDALSRMMSLCTAHAIHEICRLNLY